MNVENLKEALEQAEDKLSIFSDASLFNKYNIKGSQLVSLVREFLSDEEKIKLFDYPHFIRIIPAVKKNIINEISDSNILSQVLDNDKALEGIFPSALCEICLKLDDKEKQKILHNQEFIEKRELEKYELKKIVNSLNEEARIEELSNKSFIIDKLKCNDYDIEDFVAGLSSQEVKKQMINIYEFEGNQRANIVKTFDNNGKMSWVLEDDKLSNYFKTRILATLDTKTLSEFLTENIENLKKEKIALFEVINELDNEKQKEFVENLEHINLPLSEKRKILVTLKTEVKEMIDTKSFPEEYKTALSIKLYGSSLIDLNFERNPNDYIGLDELILEEPEGFTEEQKDKFMEICKVCPDLNVVSDFLTVVNYSSTGREYLEAEKWIDELIDSINPEYTKAQKMAIIDNAVGKKMYYSPSFGTEVFDKCGSRALWKIISSGQGVCNGIANVEKYILKRVGIDSEIVSGKGHAFLKIKDIELPLANGETVKGNTILDPTWNLTDNRFGAKPRKFLRKL